VWWPGGIRLPGRVRRARKIGVTMSLLTDEEISGQLAGLPGWSRQGDSIQSVSKRGSFAAAMLYAGAVAYLAEAANHHPDILIQWDTVTLTLSTHSAGGLTSKDMALAAQLSQLG
jgi:4a-hydroxytetrahydrobiopterin dehydratase